MGDEVIGGPHDFIGTGGVDFHVGAGNLVKKVRCAPGVNQFAVFIDAHSGCRVYEVDMFRVAAVQLAGDFGIGADRIAAEHRAILADGAGHVFESDGRWNIGDLQGRWRTGGDGGR